MTTTRTLRMRQIRTTSNNNKNMQQTKKKQH